MQNSKAFKYLAWFFRAVLLVCFIIAILQNYFSTDGTIYILGYKLTQFYPHIEARILPLLAVAFYLIRYVKHILKLEGNYYLSESIISFLVALDAFAHTNGLYSSSYDLFFYERIWFDKVTHFLEGVLLMVALFPLVVRFTIKVKEIYKSKTWAYFLILGFVSIFYVLWEILELIIDKQIGQELLVTGRYDTNEDLTFAYSGSIIALVIIESYYFVRKHLVKNRN